MCRECSCDCDCDRVASYAKADSVQTCKATCDSLRHFPLPPHECVQRTWSPAFAECDFCVFPDDSPPALPPVFPPVLPVEYHVSPCDTKNLARMRRVGGKVMSVPLPPAISSCRIVDGRCSVNDIRSREFVNRVSSVSCVKVEVKSSARRRTRGSS